MKANDFSSRLITLSAASALFLFSTTVSVQAAIINLESVNLTDVINNLGRQAGLNFLLDPSLTEPSFGPDGRVIPPPMVTARFENTTAKDALLEVLKKQNLQLVENPATKVWRVGRIGQTTTPVDSKWVAADTNSAIPLITMMDVPLGIALQNLARQAQLNIAVDPSVSRPPIVPGGRPVMPPTVAVRFENITARQALAALVENYDLVLSVDAASGAVGIAPRRKPDAAPPGPNRGSGQ